MNRQECTPTNSEKIFLPSGDYLALKAELEVLSAELIQLENGCGRIAIYLRRLALQLPEVSLEEV